MTNLENKLVTVWAVRSGPDVRVCPHRHEERSEASALSVCALQYLHPMPVTFGLCQIEMRSSSLCSRIRVPPLARTVGGLRRFRVRVLFRVANVAVFAVEYLWFFDLPSIRALRCF